MGNEHNRKDATTGWHREDHISEAASMHYRSDWLKMIGPTAKDACPKTNELWSKNGYSFDVACAGKPKMASVAIHFDNPELQHRTIDFSALPNGTPLKMHGESEDHWVSAACGDVSTEHPVIVR